MRLLYLRLPEYGPLRDTALAFPRVNVLKGRNYALHFVVGVNGTGKSSALRALFRIFDCLSGGWWPSFSFELAFEIVEAGESKPTTVCIANERPAENSGWALLHANLPAIAGAANWRKQFAALRSDPSKLDAKDVTNSNFIAKYFPKGILAYTSGTIDPWQNLRRKPLERFDLEPLRDIGPDPTERPVAWSPREELGFSATNAGEDSASDVPLEQWRAYLRKPSAADPRWRTRLLDPLDVRLAGLSVALTQAVIDLKELRDESRHGPQRREWKRQSEDAAKAQGPVSHNLRWLLTAAGLAWPSHIAFTLDRNARETWTGDTSERLLLLYTLAESVAPLPLGRERVVVSLHHRDTANIAAQLRFILGEEEADKLINGTKLEEAPPVNKRPGSKENDSKARSGGNTALADLVAAVGTPRYGADALLRLLGGRNANSLDAFRTLTFWRDQGLLVDATATFRRIDGDSVVTYDQLSDGEQQLLQRGGLLLLLRDADDQLLLLDEPETHFNDRWKRELIDVVDDNLGKTRSHVILTTHSSIVLSDAFRDEIIILTPNGVFHPSMPTFGADPSRILQHVFQSPDAIGQRAREALADWLKIYGNKLSSQERATLECIVGEVGGGPERIRLMERLDA